MVSFIVRFGEYQASLLRCQGYYHASCSGRVWDELKIRSYVGRGRSGRFAKIDKNCLNLYLNLVGTYVDLVQKSSIEMSFKNLFTV